MLDGNRDELLYFRSGVVLASRLAGVQDDTLYARRLGFGGKLCIHPRQIAPVNACFSPTADEIAWAQRVVDAAGAADGGAVQVDGKMVDRPVLLKAREILGESVRVKA